MPRDPFAELEAARATVLEEAERFVEELEPLLGPSLHAGVERLRLAQPHHVGRLNEPTLAEPLYQEALDTLNADAAAVFLYTPSNVAAIRRTLAGVRLNPYSWMEGLPDWELLPNGETRMGMR